MSLALWRILLLMLLAVSALGAGRWILSRWPGAPRSWYLAFPLGLGVLSYLMFAAGMVGALGAATVWTLVVALALLHLLTPSGGWASVLERGRSLRLALKDLGRAEIALIGVVLVLAILNLAGALAPPLGPDDLSYHFGVPQRYLAEGRVVYIPDKYYSNLPFTVEMLWMAAIRLDGGELAQALNWLIGLGVLGLVHHLAGVCGLDRRTRLLAVVLFYSITETGGQSKSGGTELAGALFFLACCAVLFRWKQNRSKSMLLLAAVFAGLFAGAKLYNLLLPSMIAVWVAMSTVRAGLGYRVALWHASIFATVSTAIVSVWFLKTWIYTGNPVYPFMTSAFGGPEIRPSMMGEGFRDLSTSWLQAVTRYNPIWKMAVQPYYMLAGPEIVRGHVSPLFVALAPFALWNARAVSGPMRLLLIFAALGYLYWVPAYRFIRIGMPVLALLAIAIAAAYQTAAASDRWMRRVLAGCLCLWIFTSGTDAYMDSRQSLSLLAGRITYDEFMVEEGRRRQEFNFHNAYVFMNRRLPADAKVLLWDSRGYYLRRPHVHSAEFLQSLADPAIYDPKHAAAELRRWGISHVAMTDNPFRLRLRRTLEASGQLDCVYRDSDMVVCRIRAN